MCLPYFQMVSKCFSSSSGFASDGGLCQPLQKKHSLESLWWSCSIPTCSACLCNYTVVLCVCSADTSVFSPDALKFNGPGPELINGRLAQWGFVSAALGEAQSGKLIAEQLQEAWPSVLFLSALIIYASLIPICKGAKREPFGELQCACAVHCTDSYHAGRAMRDVAWNGPSSLQQCALLAPRPCSESSKSKLLAHAIVSASPDTFWCAHTGISYTLM